jgi:hypothetical protein
LIPDISIRILIKQEQIVAGDPTRRLTVIATYCDFFQLGLVRAYLPRGIRPDIVQGFRVDQPMEGAPAGDVIREARRIFESLWAQLQRQNYQPKRTH